MAIYHNQNLPNKIKIAKLTKPGKNHALKQNNPCRNTFQNWNLAKVAQCRQIWSHCFKEVTHHLQMLSLSKILQFTFVFLPCFIKVKEMWHSVQLFCKIRQLLASQSRFPTQRKVRLFYRPIISSHSFCKMG